jgi:hypothetical protein
MDVTIDYLYAVIAGLLCILLISYSKFFRSKSQTQPKLPPLAAGRWPLIGHLHLLGNSNQPPYITLGNLSEKYGPIFSLRIGVHKAVIVSTWELAKEIFTTHDVIISSRPKFTAFKILGHNYANFGFSPYGEYWQRMRKITASELLSTRRFESLRDIRHTEVKKSLTELYELGGDDLKVEMKKFLGDMNLNVIMRMIAGKRYSGDEREVRKVRWVFREFFRLTGLFVVGDAIPFLGWLDLGGHVKEMKKAAIEMDSVVCGWLEEHRRRNDLGETKIEQDFVDVLLNVLDGVDLDGYDVDTVIKATCLVSTKYYYYYMNFNY